MQRGGVPPVRFPDREPEKVKAGREGPEVVAPKQAG